MTAFPTCITPSKCLKHWFELLPAINSLLLCEWHAWLIHFKGSIGGEQIIKKIFSHNCFQRSGVTCWLGSGSVTPAILEHQWVVTSTFKWRLHRVWIHHSTESQQTSKSFALSNRKHNLLQSKKQTNNKLAGWEHSDLKGDVWRKTHLMHKLSRR